MARNNYLQHFGILGMHWGIRRYQNADGTLTEAGKRRYSPSGYVEMPYVSFNTPKNMKKSMNSVTSRFDNSSKDAIKWMKKHDELQEKNKSVDPNSRKGLRNQDKLYLLEKKYVEARLRSIAYLNVMSMLMTEANNRGYEFVQKQFKDNGITIPEYVDIRKKD